jgi:DNA topoisomerase IB
MILNIDEKLINADWIKKKNKGKEIKKALYIGPRGGKWADPAFTIPYQEDEQKQKQKLYIKKEEYKKPGSQLPKEIQSKLIKLKIDKLPQASIPLYQIKVDFTGDIHSKAVIAWKDIKGKWQQGYTPKFHKNNADKKWKRVNKYIGKVNDIANNIYGKLNKAKTNSVEHQGLTILAVIAETGLRPGNWKSMQVYGHYGVSTLRKEHITFAKDNKACVLKFIGKAGKENIAIIKNKETVNAIKYYWDKKISGGEPDTSNLFSSAALDSVDNVLPKGMKVKDLRTVKATIEAEKALQAIEIPPPFTGDIKKDKRLLATALMAASKKVSSILNNTPSIAKASYIHPQVFIDWMAKINAPKELVREL